MSAHAGNAKQHGTRVRQVVRLTVCALVCTVAAAAAADVADLRLYAVRPDVFDYLFTSVSIGADGKPLLAFKDLSGTTRFVHVGDRVGDWDLVAYHQQSELVFKASVGARLAVDTSTATLRHATGQERTLIRGAPLEQAGHMACLISLKTGAWVYARGGDTVTLDAVAVTVKTVGEASAQVQSLGRPFEVALASDAEREDVMARWRAQQAEVEARARQQAEAQRLQEAERVAAEHEAAARMTAHTPARPAAFSFGVEYRYPTEYEVVPYIVRLVDGRYQTQAIVVPTRFRTRIVGHSLETY